MYAHGLQTRGIFACNCEISPQSIKVGWLFLESLSLAGKNAALVRSEADDQTPFTVQIPAVTTTFSQNIELKRL